MKWDCNRAVDIIETSNQVDSEDDEGGLYAAVDALPVSNSIQTRRTE